MYFLLKISSFLEQKTYFSSENVVFFDFTSMYGSVIVSFNLSRESYLNKKEKGATMVDIGEKVYFDKNKAGNGVWHRTPRNHLAHA